MAKGTTAEKSMDFAIRIVNLYKYLTMEKKEYTLSKQLLRSGTSIGANLSEAEYSVSKKEFLSKVGISLKECNETLFWLELLHRTDYLLTNEYESINNDCTEIMKLLTSISKTTATSLNTNN